MTSLGTRPNRDAQWNVWGSRIIEWAHVVGRRFTTTLCCVRICKRVLEKATTLTKIHPIFAFFPRSKETWHDDIYPADPRKRDSRRANDPSFTSTIFARQFYTPYTSYPLRCRFLVSLWNITLLFGARSEADDRVIYDSRMREYKSDVLAFYSATKERETMRQDVLTKFFHSVFRFKRHDCGNNGRESTNHTINRPSTFLDGRSTNLALQKRWHSAKIKRRCGKEKKRR